MLVLTRKAGERIVIGDSIVVEVLEIQANRVRIGIQAPSGVTILRQELVLDKDRAVADPGRQPLPGQASPEQPSRLVGLLSHAPGHVG
jgi:carbon storage regulator